MVHKAVNVLLLFIGTVVILYFAKPLLAPLTIAAILAMLFRQLAAWFEHRGASRALAALGCVLCFSSVVAGITFLLSWQFNGLMEDIASIEKNVNERFDALQQYINASIGISPEKQKQLVSEQAKSSSSAIPFLVDSLMSAVLDLILIPVYFFLLLFLRSHILQFVLRIVPSAKKVTVSTICNECCHVAQRYLLGLGIMIFTLWVMYGIGFSIIGVRHALFFAVLCGLLEIIPFVGNLTGNIFTVLMVISQGGSTGMVIAVVATYLLVQLIQTYFLEPLIVGREVNINPLFTILILVAGELTWGVAGMVVALPCLAIAKIIFDRVPALVPYGTLIGKTKKEVKKVS